MAVCDRGVVAMKAILFRLLVSVPILLLALPTSGIGSVAQAASNPIVLENQQPGTTAWQIDTDSSSTPLLASHHEIEGYASATSVNSGSQISFMVNVSKNASYTMDIYRMGYYGGTGGRLMQSVGTLSGTPQPACARTTTTTNFGLTECNWAPGYTLNVPTTWTTGVYLVKLKRLDVNLESYMTFVVRNDATTADIVLSEDVTTWQAYNFWGGSGNNNNGYSLYGQFNDVTYDNTSNTRASAVSFDRPYLVQGETDGAGQFFMWDFPMVKWLEGHGYNVTYATDVDIETNPGLLSGRKALINTGHDEYYSAAMRNNLQGYINGGAHAGFFSANNVYYQMRWSSDSNGTPYRTEICYKSASLDSTTIRWRDLSPPQPENAINGVMQNGVANDRAFRVYDASSWIYAGTGLVNYVSGNPVTSGPGQNAIAGIVGYEFDERAANDSGLSAFVPYEPAGLQQVAHSLVPAGDNGVQAYSDATVYTASSGAIVFSAGTLQWSWGLDAGYNSGGCGGCNVGYVNSASQQITANILTKFLNTTPTPPVVSLSPTSLTFNSQAVNSTSPAQTVTLTNSGGAPLTINSISVTGANGADFSQTNTCPTGSTTLAVNASCAINVTFTPSASGSRSATVSISDDAGGSPQSVSLSGTGAAAPLVHLSPTSLTFTNQQIGTISPGQTVTVTNTGSAALTISSIGFNGTNAADFSETTTCPFNPSTVPAGGSCTISVSFMPNGSGTRTGSLSIADDAGNSPQSISLTGTGTSTPVPAVSLSPSSLTFSAQAINTTSPAQAVTLTNTGNADLSLSTIGTTGTNSSDFAQTNTCPSGSATLAAGSSCTISVTFTPSDSGSRTASLTITDNAGDSPQSVSLTGTGSLTAGTYLVDGFETGNLSAWNTATSPGGSETVQSTAVNSGSYAAALTNAANTDYSNLYADLSGGGQTLTYTRFCFNLTGISGSDVLAQGRDVNGNNLWEVDYDAGSKGLDMYLWNGARTRTDLTSPRSLILPSSWYCAEVEVNETTGGHGELWLNGTSVAKVDTDLSVTNPYSRLLLWNNGAAGTAYYDDIKASNAYNGPVGAGAAPLPAPAVSLSPTGLTFSSQIVNTSSGTQTVTLTNTGTAPLTISSVGLSGANAGDYGQANTCPLSPSTVPAGGTCTINVTFTPTASGTRTANLSITDNAPGSPQSVSLSGTAVPPPAPVVTLSPTGLTFSSQTVNTTSATQSVTLTNTGNDPLAISGLAVTGANSGDFTEADTCPTGATTLAVGASCTVTVSFMPAATGTRTASVTVTDNAADSPQGIALTGTGSLPDGTYLQDDFEHGLRIWAPTGNGTATEGTTVVNSGSYAASLSNASNQFTGLSAGLAGSGQVLTYSRFCFNLSGISGSTVLAQGRDSTGTPVWEVDYDAGLQGLDLYLWNGARVRTDLATPTHAVAMNTWYCAEVEVNEATSGHGELWLNGTSVTKIDTDLSVTNPYSQMFLWNNGATGTAYFDDIKVSNAYNGPVGAGSGGPAVRLSPSSLSFGNQPVGTTSGIQTVTLTNNGAAPLSIASISVTGTNAGDFAQTNTCPTVVVGGGTCTISVTFSPSDASPRNASLTVTDDAGDSPQSVGLAGTGVPTAPAATFTPTNLSFGDQLVNTISQIQTITLSNSGNAPMTITSIGVTGTNSADFGQTNTCPDSSSTLAAGASCTINVTFAPGGTGTRSASISVADNASGSPQTVSLSGNGTAPSVSLSPSSLTFGNQTTGTTSSAQLVTLTNSGTGSLAISTIGFTGTNPGDFSQTNTCPASLGAGSSCTVSVSFAPSDSGTRSANLTFTDSAGNSPQSVAVSGTGVAPAPAATLSAPSIGFGNQNTGTTSPAQSVTLTNTGGAALTISSIGITGTNAGDFSQTTTCPISPSTLVAGGSCTISATFKPTSTGARSASISIADNASGAPHTVGLSGTGTAPAVSLSPTSLTFSGQMVNTSSSARSVTLTNSGTGPLTVTSISVTGTNASDFSQTNTCPSGSSTLAAGSTCSISVTFKPGATGSRSASISIADNAGGSPQTVPLSGTGTAPAVSLSPTSLTFLSQSVGTSSPTQSVTVTNTGTAPLTITAIGFSGTNTGDFSQTNTCPLSPSTLAVNGTCTVTVTFKPTLSGTRTASLAVTDNAVNSPQTVPLTGTGTLAAVTLSSTSISFGTTNVGTSANSKSVTLTNSGTASLTITSIGMTGLNPGDFSQTNNCPLSPSTLAAKAKCTITITFKPTAKGSRSATLSIADSASGGGHQVALSGTGK